MTAFYIYLLLWFFFLSFLAWWRITWTRRYAKHIDELLQIDSTYFAPWLRYRIDCIANRRMMIRLKELARKDRETFNKEMENW